MKDAAQKLKIIVEELKQNDEIISIVQSGSSTNTINDNNSDIDIYIYSNDIVPVTFREGIIKKHSKKYEINNTFWETGDEWIDEETNTSFDFMYRSPNWLKEQVENVWVKNYASIGYTTCFLHNIKTSKILYDKNNTFLKIQNLLNTPYPEKLVQAIISKNYPILKKNISSYKAQIEKAILREDTVSINHRISALLASYFDIIFAINKVFHPGEKKLIQFVNQKCTYKPKNFENNISNILNSDFTKLAPRKVELLLRNLDILLKEIGYMQE